MSELLRHPRYRALDLLGRGAQGRVVRVVDVEAPTRLLVAKVYAAGVFDAELLASEFALLSRLRIPGLVHAHDLGRDEASDAPFLVEDFVDGPDAASWVDEASETPERVRRLLELLARTSATLAALHDAGFVHGDLKPAHVRVAAGPRPMILDLGAAVSRARAMGPLVVSRGFASPEILAGAPPSIASDLFALGATAWAVAAGAAPGAPRARVALRRQASWVPPSIERLIVRLIAEHPRDRPRHAREVMAELAQSASWAAPVDATSRGFSGLMVGRARELEQLLSASTRVLYVAGAPAIGKSSLVREAVTQSLLRGRSTRLVSFPCGDFTLVQRLIAFFRGAAEAWPFRHRPEKTPFFLALDELDRAPDDLVSALEAYRCRPLDPRGLIVIATVREAPEGADALRLGALEEAAMRELIGPVDSHRSADLLELAAGNPGVLVAAVGRMPLSADAVREHLRTLSSEAKLLLGAIAVAGGELAEILCEQLVRRRTLIALGELSRAGLIGRRARDESVVWALGVPSLAPDLASACGSFELADALADALLGETAWPAELLLSVAAAPNPPARRRELLARAAERAKAEGLRSIEVDALLALAADPSERSCELLIELDRVTRGGGSSGLHPELVSWLKEAAERYPELEPLALRRRADDRARAGDYDGARSLAEQARAAALVRRNPPAEGLALAMTGAIELYRANWPVAAQALEEARALLAGDVDPDPEEMARIHHNLGVVALYRGRTDDAIAALERSLVAKRKMGDRGGIWTCLLNLGIAFSKARRFDEARSSLDEALALSRSLGQTAGAAWCVLARAEVGIRSGQALEAEQWLAEAEALGDRLPEAVRPDLSLARVELALLELRASDAIRLLGELEPFRSEDALCDARALVLEARARLATLPVDRRRVARTAIAALRRARQAQLPEQEEEAGQVLRQARNAASSRPVRAGSSPPRYASLVREDSSAASVWPFIETLAAGERLETAAVDLCRLVLAGSGAERVLLAFVRAHDQIERAFGADLDGLAIGECTKRVPLDLVNQALARSEPIYHRELETLGGRGSILAVSAPAIHGSLRSVVIAEHRFSPARFDEVSEARAREWATLAQLLVRLSSTDGRPADAAHDEPEPPSETALELESSTSLPARGSGRAFTSIVGSSPVLRSALARLEAALATDLPLLIVGETGVGKELFARAVHDHGPRKGKPFIAVNCAAIPETLFEAELFGHAKGSFTGAERTRPGLLARAEGGTLLLDEVGELPISRQAVLLRALESGAYRPVGSDSEHRFDVRIVSATNRDLKQAAAKREFRPDLLYRLNVLEVRVPPLRERSDDVVPLVRHFLARHTGIVDMPISPSALEALQTHDWPGNVRELEHCVQRLTAAGLTRIDLAHLPREIRAAAKARPRRPLQRASQRERTGSQVDERGQVASALQAVGGNISRAAARLGLTRHGLKKKMLRLGIRAEGGPGPGRPPASTRAVPATRARPRRQRSGE